MRVFNFLNKRVTDRAFIFRSIAPFLRNRKMLMLLLVILKVLSIVTGITEPYFYKVLIDKVLIAREFSFIVPVLAGYLSLYAIDTVILSGQMVLHNKIFNKLLFDIKKSLLKKYLLMPVTFFDEFSSADLKMRIDADADAFEPIIKDNMVEYICSWIYSVVLLVILLSLSWKLALFGFFIIPLSFWMTKKFGKAAGKAQEAYRKDSVDYEEWLKGVIQNWREIKSFCIQEDQKIKFSMLWGKLGKIFFSREIIVITYNCLIVLKDFFISRMSLYLIGGILIFYGEMSVGALFVFLRYFEQFVNNISRINELDLQLNLKFPSLKKTIEILNYPEPDCPRKQRMDLKGDISLENVYFKYKTSQDYVLNDISVRINHCEKVAVVGRSGSGKTSLIKVILKLYDKERGIIKIGGYDTDLINPADLYRNIGVVMQDSILFNMTIKENLLLANPKATDSDIENACKAAFIHSYINELPEKYDTIIGEKGIKLSGGQRQRIAIARALLKNPGIIIFDEATSALDHESEKMINEALMHISKSKTVIIIAHRPSSIQTADKVIVIDNGKICGYDSHQKLIRSNSYYAELFNTQYKGVS